MSDVPPFNPLLGLAAWRRQEFVGRDNEKRIFSQILEQVRTSPAPIPKALLISGEAGVGKSWLVKEICTESQEQGATVFFVDLAVEEPDPKAALLSLREQADRWGLSDRFPNFDSALEQLSSGKLAIQDGLKPLEARDSLSLRSSNVLTESMILDLSDIARDQTILLAIDRLDKGAEFRNWLRISFLARLTGRLLFVVSGQRDNLMEFVQVLGPKQVYQRRLDPFVVDEAEQYFDRLGIACERDIIPRVLRITSGSPLALSMLAALAINREGQMNSEFLDGLPKSEVVAGMTQYLLSDLSPGEREAVYAMSIFRTFDSAVLAHVLQTETGVRVDELARRLPFLELSDRGWQMHKTVSSFIFRQFRQAEPVLFTQANERAAEYYQRSLIKLEASGIQPPAQYSNREWIRATTYLFWHLMLCNENKAAQFVMLEFLKALRFRVNFVTLLELADELEEYPSIVVDAVEILRAVCQDLLTDKMAQLKEDLLIVRRSEFCNEGASVYVDELLEAVELEIDYSASRPSADFIPRTYLGACVDCACPSLSPEACSYYLELTPDCSNTCPGCLNTFVIKKPSQRSWNGSPFLRAKDWVMLLKKIAPSTLSLKITGGEPTLHPDFDEIVVAVEELRIPFAIFTNGRWSNPQRIVELIQRASCCQGLLISLHGARAEEHEAFSGVAGCFEETVSNIRLATQAGLSVSISTVLTSRNCNSVERIVELADLLHVSQVVFNRYIGPAIAGLELTPQALRTTILRIERLRRAGASVRFGPCIPSCFVASSAAGCFAGASFAAIDPWGNVKPCSHAPLIVGNLVNQSLREIWNSDGMMLWDALVPRRCPACSEYATCHGGCRANALLLQQDRDPLIARALRKPQPQSLVTELGKVYS